MKYTLASLIFIVGLSFPADAQIINVKKSINNAVMYKTNTTINSEVNQGVNELFSAPGKIFRKVKASSQNQNNSSNQNSSSQ